MALLHEMHLDTASTPDPEALLKQFDLEATLDPNSPSHGPALPPHAIPLIDSIENASEQGNILGVKEALTRLRVLVHPQDIPCTGSALARAVDCQRCEVVAFLLSEGVQVSHNEVKNATLSKDKAILQLLFEQGWDINRELGWSDPPALAYAVEDIDLATWFLAHGADPNARCTLGWTPLSAAVQYAPLQNIKMLFDHGGRVEHGQLLHAAIWRKFDDRKAVVEYILERGASVNGVMYQKMPEIYLMRQPFGLGTPLHDAAAIGDEYVTRLLVNRGARLDAKDSLGLLAFERAEANGHQTIAKFLRERLWNEQAVTVSQTS